MPTMTVANFLMGVVSGTITIQNVGRIADALTAQLEDKALREIEAAEQDLGYRLVPVVMSGKKNTCF